MNEILLSRLFVYSFIFTRISHTLTDMYTLYHMEEKQWLQEYFREGKHIICDRLCCKHGALRIFQWWIDFGFDNGVVPNTEWMTSVQVHDDVIKWKHFPRYWPFVPGIHRSTVNSPHKGPVMRSFDVFFDLKIISGWVNNREAGDLRRHRAHSDVIVMSMMYDHVMRLLMDVQLIKGSSRFGWMQERDVLWHWHER